MDVEDEPNSYLKYLSDSEAQNTFLLETSEVGMFSDVPIFTEIETTDWPQDGFPLLLTNPLITNGTEDQDTQNTNLDGQNFENAKLDANIYTVENTRGTSDSFAKGESLGVSEICVNKSGTNGETRIIHLLNNEGNTSILKSLNLIQTKSNNQKKVHSVNDLFTTVISNKCKICSYLCENLEQIKIHIIEKHSELIFPFNGKSNGVSLLIQNQKKNLENGEIKTEYTVYVCSVCHDVCMNRNNLREHMIKAHDLTTELDKIENPQKKEIQSNNHAVYRKSSLLSDLTVSVIKKQEKTLQKIKCSIKGCSAGFPTEEICKRHEALHDKEFKSYFKCEECNEKFKMWRIARNHMHKQHGIDFGMISCPLCNAFKNYHAVTILRHMVIHSKERPFVCAECGKTFKQWPQLKNHEIIHKSPEELPSWCKIKKCDKCDRYFSNSKCLKTHIQAVHNNFKPFFCNICGHKTTRKAMLELHLRQHTGVKPYKCDFCPYKTGDYNCLRKHVMKHVGAVQYTCPHCPYTCIQSGSLKSHLKNKHKGKGGTFSCKYCRYTTINPTFLHAHEKRHHNSSEERNSQSLNTTGEQGNKSELQVDEETQSCFLNSESQIEETVDNGGITIPADLELQLNP